MFGLLINAVFLYLIGRNVEGVVGRGPLLAIWFTAGLGAATALGLFYPVQAWSLAQAGLFGLFAAVMIIKHRAGHDIRSDLILLGIMVVFSLVLGAMGGSLAALVSLLGGIAAGCATGAILAYPRGRNRVRTQRVGITALMVVLLLASVTAAWL